MPQPIPSLDVIHFRVILITFLQIVTGGCLHAVHPQPINYMIEDTCGSQTPSHDLQENMNNIKFTKNEDFQCSKLSFSLKFIIIIFWLCLLWGPSADRLLNDPYTYTQTCGWATACHNTKWDKENTPLHQSAICWRAIY